MTRVATTSRNMAVVKTLTYLMFAMFAMTTDSVGIIIPEVIRTFQLSLTAAGTFQYATMTGIALAGLMLGQLADRNAAAAVRSGHGRPDRTHEVRRREPP